MERNLHSVNRIYSIEVACSDTLLPDIKRDMIRKRFNNENLWLSLALGNFCAQAEKVRPAEVRQLFDEENETDDTSLHMALISVDEPLYLQYAKALSQEDQQDSIRLWNRIVKFALQPAQEL